MRYLLAQIGVGLVGWVIVFAAAGATWNLTGEPVVAVIAGLGVLAGFTVGLGYAAVELAGEIDRDRSPHLE
jgi:hypothetical protein